MTMVNVCHVVMYIFLVGTPVVALLNVCYERCRRKPAEEIPEEPTDQPELPVTGNQDQHEDLPVTQTQQETNLSQSQKKAEKQSPLTTKQSENPFDHQQTEKNPFE